MHVKCATRLIANMNILKRATTSILRRLGKTIILLLLVFILGTVIAGAISVRGAINITEENLRAGIPPIVSISHDWELQSELYQDMLYEGMDDEEIMEYFRDLRVENEMTITAELVRTIGELPYVRDFDYSITTRMYSFDLVRYDEEHTEMWDDLALLDLVGGSNLNLVQIEQGIIEIVSGRTFEDSEILPDDDTVRSVAIVSDVWADANNLSLGSTFTLYSFVQIQGMTYSLLQEWFLQEEIINERVGVEFDIIGIFRVVGERIENPQTSEEFNLASQQKSVLNRIYVPNWILESVSIRAQEVFQSAWDAVDFDHPWDDFDSDQEDEIGTAVVPLFVLEDARQIPDFQEAAEELLPMFHRFDDFSNSFVDIESSMNTLQGIANWILF